MDNWQNPDPFDEVEPQPAPDVLNVGSVAAATARAVGDPFEDQPPDEPVVEAADEAKPLWYVVHCYSGYENKVKKNLEHRIESMGMQNRIKQVIVPTEEQIELRDGQRRVVERRIYPGYVLVQMTLDEESWYVVRNTPGVTGFVGIGNKPTPLRQEEVDRIMHRIEAEEPVPQVKVKVGDKVRIIEGSFTDFHGTIDEVYPDKGKARVLVSFFNRETPIEVDLLQIERI
ncbi:MAG: transcription termination/antitermination protein NusG [Anaerolineae bacterium]